MESKEIQRATGGKLAKKQTGLKKQEGNAPPAPLPPAEKPPRRVKVASIPFDIADLDFPKEPAQRQPYAKVLFLDIVGSTVLTVQHKWLVQGDEMGPTADSYMRSLFKSIQPRDAVEEMMVMQMAWTHARMARLSTTDPAQNGIPALRAINDACDHAANTFRRQMLALAEYRRPARSDGFTVVKQVNNAQQQVVANGQIPNLSNPSPSNELGQTAPAALPAHAQGLGLPAPSGHDPAAVEVEYRPQDGGGKSPLPDERP